MTITKCDICDAEIPFGKPSTPGKIDGKAELTRTESPDVVYMREFTYEVGVTCFQFNTTNFAVCRKCLIKSITESLKLAEGLK